MLALTGAATLAIGFAVAGPASSGAGAADQATTTVVMAGTSERDQAVDSPLANAVSRALGGRTVTGARAIEDDVRSYTTLDIDGGLRATVYRVFDASELDGADLPRAEVAGGTAWTGSDSPDLTSVYFLSGDDIGVWVASAAHAEVAPLSITDLVAAARRLVADPAVQQEAGR